ncbi:MAG TPA: hypothetical protein H9694_04615 [Firmicutes bacterium]|nr:hypothetical protein [Bacillota bacterium]
MNRSRRILYGAVLAAALTALSGCGTASPAGTASGTGESTATPAQPAGTETTTAPAMPSWENNAQVEETGADAPAGFKAVAVTFRDHNPIRAELVVPQEWELVPVNDAAPHLLYSPVNILVDGESVGFLGNFPIELPEGASPQDEYFYVAVYNQLMSSAATWDNQYTPVKQTDTACAATCLATYEAQIMPDGRAREDPAVLAYDLDQRKYVGLAVSEGFLTPEQQTTVAESLTLAAA